MFLKELLNGFINLIINTIKRYSSDVLEACIIGLTISILQLIIECSSITINLEIIYDTIIYNLICNLGIGTCIFLIKTNCETYFKTNKLAILYINLSNEVLYFLIISSQLFIYFNKRI